MYSVRKETIDRIEDRVRGEVNASGHGMTILELAQILRDEGLGGNGWAGLDAVPEVTRHRMLAGTLSPYLKAAGWISIRQRRAGVLHRRWYPPSKPRRTGP